MRALIILLFVAHYAAHAQTVEEAANTLTEDVTDLNEEQDDGAVFENMAHLLSHKINLNIASEEDLKLLNILRDEQVMNLLQHRKENGKLLSVYELQSIEEFDIETIRKILPYIEITPPAEVLDKTIFKRMTTEGSNYLMILAGTTLEKKEGYNAKEKTSAFQGSPLRTLLRFRSSRPGDFSIGMTCEKDEGERFRWNAKQHTYGFDFLSFHAQVQNKGKLKNLIIGNYQTQFGQGLVYGGAAGFGKGAESITTIRKADVGVVPYTSAYEAGSLRGLGATYSPCKNTFVTLLFSNTKRDAALEKSETDITATSLQLSGLHRNKNDLEKRGALKETICGAIVQYKRSNFSLGTTMQYLKYGFPIKKDPTPYNQFAFAGINNTNASSYLSYNLHNLSLFGEFATSMGYGNAMILGALASLTKKFDLSILFRKYDVNYFPFYGNGLSENTSTTNENGFYWGWKYKFNRRFSYAGYFDIFQFPWLKYRTYAPSSGTEWLMRLSWQPNRHTLFYVQTRGEQKVRNVSEEKVNTYSIRPISKFNYWFNIDYTISNTLKMRTRVQVSNMKIGSTRTSGFLLFHDATLSFHRFKFTGRYALFQTDDYDNRQYAYENDVWLSYSLPAYFGTGTRKYILVQYKPTRSLTFWLRYSHTRFIDQETIGAGADMIAGNQRNDIKFEARFNF